MSWQFGLVLSYIAVVAQALWQRAYSQKSELPESFPPAISYMLAVTPLGIVVGLTMNHHVLWTPWLGVLLALEGVLIGAFNWLSFMAIKRLPIAQFQLIFQSYAVVTIVLGWVLLHETLNVPQIIGGVLLLAAAVIATQTPVAQPGDKPRASRKPAIILAVLSAFGLGAGLVVEKAALHYMDIGAYFIFGFGTQTIALMLLALRDVKKGVFSKIRPRDVRRSFIMGVISVVVGFLYIFVIKRSNNVSLITALEAFGLPLIVLASYIILKERENTKRLFAAAALGCIGIIVTAL